MSVNYDENDYGRFFRDDHRDWNASVRPGAEAASYRVAGQDGEFFSPEEVVLRLQALAPGGFGLDLRMCDQEAAKFLRVWRAMQGG